MSFLHEKNAGLVIAAKTNSGRSDESFIKSNFRLIIFLCNLFEFSLLNKKNSLYFIEQFVHVTHFVAYIFADLKLNLNYNVDKDWLIPACKTSSSKYFVNIQTEIKLQFMQ